MRNFAELAPNIGFSEFDLYDLYRSTFEMSELGRMKKLLPLHAMSENFGLVSKSMRPKLGRRSFFTHEEKVAPMSLKMYTGLSCPKLLEQLNGNQLPDILRRDNRSDTAIDELQAVGRHNDETCKEVEDTTAPWHPHGKRSSADGQDRTEVEFGGCLTLKLAVNAELSWGNDTLVMKNIQNNLA